MLPSALDSHLYYNEKEGIGRNRSLSSIFCRKNNSTLELVMFPYSSLRIHQFLFSFSLFFTRPRDPHFTEDVYSLVPRGSHWQPPVSAASLSFFETISSFFEFSRYVACFVVQIRKDVSFLTLCQRINIVGSCHQYCLLIDFHFYFLTICLLLFLLLNKVLDTFAINIHFSNTSFYTFD